MLDNRKLMAEEWNAGCSALSWSTQDGKHLWGRNFDFNRLAQGTKVSYIPSGTEYYTCGATMERNLDRSSRCRAAYAALGTGFLMIPSVPVLYEGINERGLMGGQLYYREFAHFADKAIPGTLKVQPPYVVYHVLAQCATVAEAADLLKNKVTIMNLPLFGSVPTLHWAFSDRTGEMIVVEPDRDGLKVYRNTIGVMTNSPGYSWHRLNLLNYAGIRDLDYDVLDLESDRLNQCFSGSGAQGLPGDWSSPSRFVRLAFLKTYGVKGATESAGVGAMFRLLQSAAFPLGMVRVPQPESPGGLEGDILPYDYTVYTAVACAESLRFYWTTYENQRIQFVDLSTLRHQTRPVQFELGRWPDFRELVPASASAASPISFVSSL